MFFCKEVLSDRHFCNELRQLASQDKLQLSRHYGWTILLAGMAGKNIRTVSILLVKGKKADRLCNVLSWLLGSNGSVQECSYVFIKCMMNISFM